MRLRITGWVANIKLKCHYLDFRDILLLHRWHSLISPHRLFLQYTHSFFCVQFWKRRASSNKFSSRNTYFPTMETSQLFFFPVYWDFQMRLCEGCQLPTQKTPPNSSTFEGAAGGWCQSNILYHSICELLCGRCVHIWDSIQ